MSPAAREYLTYALDLLEHKSIDADKVDWPQLRARAFEAAEGARLPAHTYPAIRLAIGELGNPHTMFISPVSGLPGDEQPEPPTGRILPGGYALLTVPRVLADDETTAAYVRDGVQAVKELDRAEPCGWIVDLRRDGGGDMWPMLTTLAPLLIGPTLGYFVDASGGRVEWMLRDGQLSYGGAVPLQERNNYVLARPQPPVAILTGRGTASAGVATLIAFRGQPNTRTFGEPTSPITSANFGFELSDGAVLLISYAYNADRTGHVYPDRTPIPPDQPVANPLGRVDPDEPDPVIDAAMQWLARAPACRSTLLS